MLASLAHRLGPGFPTPLLYPSLLAVAAVIGLFRDVGYPITDLGRPLVLVITAAAITTLLLWPVFGRHLAPAVVATVIVGLLDPRYLSLVALAAVAWVLYRRLRDRPVTVPYRPQLVVSLVWVAMLTVTVILPELKLAPRPAAASEDEGGPNIYLVLLDGYPRGDTLEQWGYDNSPFFERLAELGFDVAPGSESNYTQTALTMLTMLHMRHTAEIEGLTPEVMVTTARDPLLTLHRTNPVFEFLRERGYRLATSPPPAHTLTLRGADERLPEGGLSAFEVRLVERTALERIAHAVGLDPLGDSHRAHVEQGLENLVTLAERRDSARFGFVHILSPHTPIVYDDDGSPLGPLGCAPECGLFHIHADQLGMTPEEFRARYWAQVAALNGLVLDALERVVHADPDAIVIVFSDHGVRDTFHDADEWFRTLFAARTPGRPDLFGEAPRLVNVFPTLFNAYFDADLALQPGDQYRSVNAATPLVLERR